MCVTRQQHQHFRVIRLSVLFTATLGLARQRTRVPRMPAGPTFAIYYVGQQFSTYAEVQKAIRIVFYCQIHRIDRNAANRMQRIECSLTTLLMRCSPGLTRRNGGWSPLQRQSGQSVRSSFSSHAPTAIQSVRLSLGAQGPTCRRIGTHF